VVDDDPDITLTFNVGLEGYYYHDNDKIRFEVYTYNNSLIALSGIERKFYDVPLTDIRMPKMNGFELCQKILKLDINIRICIYVFHSVFNKHLLNFFKLFVAAHGKVQ
jgi:CheY-like chemotaxis protein